MGTPGRMNMHNAYYRVSINPKKDIHCKENLQLQLNVKELDIVGPFEKINKQVRVSREVAQHFSFFLVVFRLFGV